AESWPQSILYAAPARSLEKLETASSRARRPIVATAAGSAAAARIAAAIAVASFGGTTHPTSCSVTVIASSVSGSAIASVGLPLAKMLYRRLGIDTPVMPARSGTAATSHAFRYRLSASGGHGGSQETLPSLRSAICA